MGDDNIYHPLEVDFLLLSACVESWDSFTAVCLVPEQDAKLVIIYS